MADMDGLKTGNTGAIDDSKDFHVGVPAGKTNFHVKGMDNVD